MTDTRSELAALEAQRLVRIQWEALWATYCAKGERIEELREMGRYGYQLRMPKKSLRLAADALSAFEAAHNIPFTLTAPWR